MPNVDVTTVMNMVADGLRLFHLDVLLLMVVIFVGIKMALRIFFPNSGG